MPTRLIREGLISSEDIDRLTVDAERFFTRLMLKADDYGRYSANPTYLRNTLYPLKKGIRDTDTTRWLAECEKAGVVRCYSVLSKRYLEIVKFRQRKRAEKSLFPAEIVTVKGPADACPSNDGHLTGAGPPNAALGVVGGEAVVGVVVGGGAAGGPPPPPIQNSDNDQKSDEEWLKGLASDPTYVSLNITMEYGKMKQWCKVKNFIPSRRRFINWINKCDRSMVTKQSQIDYTKF